MDAGVAGGVTPDWNGDDSSHRLLSESLSGVGKGSSSCVDLETSLEEDSLEVEDFVLSHQEMVVEEGILEPLSRRKLPGCVVIISQRLATFLLLLDGRLPADTHFFISEEAVWLRKCMSLQTVGVQYSSMAALFEGAWKRDDLVDTTFLIQGTSRFCSQSMALVHKAGFSGCTKVLVLVSGRISSADARTLGLKCTRFRHHEVGGVTSGHYSLGFSRGILLGDKLPALPLSSIRRSLLKQLKGDVYGRRCARPPSVPVERTSSPFDPRIPVSPLSLLEEFSVPSVYRPDGWVLRKLTTGEVGTAIDLPVESMAALSRAVKLDLIALDDLLCLPPMKAVQFAVELLEGMSSSRVQAALTSSDNGPQRLALSSFAPAVESKAAEAINAKATKSDDAATNVSFWDDGSVARPVEWQPRDFKTWPYLCEPSKWVTTVGTFDPATHGVIFSFLRRKMAARFAKNVANSFQRYFNQKYSPDVICLAEEGNFVNPEVEKDWKGGKEAIDRARGATFWDWSMGSSPFFWRWQPEVMKDMRDGTPFFVKGELPSFKQPQRMPKDPSIAQRIKDKVNKVRLRSYIAIGLVLSLTSYFHVLKGLDDIRIVYDLTACGLNDALWAPTFWMPAVISVLDCATHSSWFGDVDAGEMFLNYWLDETMRPYAGVDVSWDSESGATRWERWTRCAMGMLPSPWITTRLFAWAMEIIKGDRLDETNPFYWSEIVLNLPGMDTYDPSMPRVYKWNDLIGAIACDCRTFMDDLRSIGPTKEWCRRATHRAGTLMGYLGLQNAMRKRRPDSQVPGEWTGAIILALEGIGLFVTVSQSKWDKAKRYLEELLETFDSAEDLPSFNRKDLESKVGFLVHMSMTFPLMKPFLRGIYLTMNSWRPQRDWHGWKLSKKAFATFMSFMRRTGDYAEAESSQEDDEAPVLVKAVPSLYEQVRALSYMFGSLEPTLRLIRATQVMEVCYFFGDASGEGFGSAWQTIANVEEQSSSSTQPQGCIGWRFGVWGKEGVDTSSNYRELRNLVEGLEAMGKRGDLEGREVFLFTDNMVSESIASRGSSTSKALFELIVKVYILEMNFQCRIQFIHVAGTRMIASGVDGLSRGDMYEGVMKGVSMLQFVPLHKGAFEVSPPLLKWISSWAIDMGNEVEVLDPEGWFVRGHDVVGGSTNCDGVWIPSYRKGTMLWAPPPAAARQAVEELRQARHKRQDSFHVFVCPRLMYDEWRKHQFKAADMILEMRAGVSDIWPKEMHETLIICFYFPYLNRNPWELKRTRLLVELEGQMSQLLKSDHAAAGRLLSKILLQAKGMDALPLRKLRKLLHG